jgi:glycosyltransferase involved in cell wall biosynthesis
MDRILRICVVADHASYRFGGQGVLPLHYFSRLRARKVETWLVVHGRTREELETLFPADRDRIRFIEDAWFHRLLFALGRFLPRRVSESTVELLNQLLTQYAQRRVVRALTKKESINLVHQPIPVSPRFPSLMANLGVPVVIGPMNGGMEYPPAFRHTESMISRLSVFFERRLSNLASKILPGKKLASVLLVANERTLCALPSCAQGEVLILSENGVDLETWCALPASARLDEAQGPPRFVFVGRLIDWKGVDMLIEALVLLPGVHLEVIGEGPMRASWQKLAKTLGVSTRIVFSGWLPQRTCALRLQSAIALVLPSIYESGGAVVLEAMATATPVIATRWGGPMDYLDETCGVMVEPSSRQAIVLGFVDAMRKLIADPYLRCYLGNNGQQRVQMYFDWERKIDSMIGIYQRAISEADLYEDAISTIG